MDNCLYDREAPALVPAPALLYGLQFFGEKGDFAQLVALLLQQHSANLYF
jgi:hypothetical protein